MPESADILFVNTAVYTSDPACPRAEAVAIRGNRIAFVGSDEDANSWRGPHTRLIDGLGHTLLPGFIDAHFHLLHGSLELGDIQLEAVRNPRALYQTVLEFVSLNPGQPIYAGYGLRYGTLPGGANLTRHDLDNILPDQPLIVWAYDAHTAWANTRALEEAGLLQGGNAGPNSEIVRGADGLATGELRESGAFGPIRDLIPAADDRRKRDLLHQGLAEAARLGVTSVHNMDGDADQMTLYAALEDLDELTVRVYVPYSVTPETPLEMFKEAAALRQQFKSDGVRAGSVKFFMDGVIESYTGLLLDPYDDADTLGDANYNTEHYHRMVVEADRLGLQVLVHAVGDAAVRRTLDGFAEARRINGPRDSRHRVEHIEVIHPDDLPRFADLGVIASMQPIHAPLSGQDADVWLARIGPNRWGRSFAWRSLREMGAKLVFGSDWPVASQNPLIGVQSTLTRQPWADGLPHHRQTLDEALLSYTRDAAFAEFQEDRKGQIRVGLLADLVLLSADITRTLPDNLMDVSPRLTMVGGRVVFEA